MDEKINSLSQKCFDSLFTRKRFLKNTQYILIEGVAHPVEWSIEVYIKNNI
jgi:hypothetical protein